MNNRSENNGAKSQLDIKQKKHGEKGIPKKAREAAKQLREMNQAHVPSDTLGSYTGTAYDGEAPSQDADDL